MDFDDPQGMNLRRRPATAFPAVARGMASRADFHVTKASVLRGLHHDYRLEREGRLASEHVSCGAQLARCTNALIRRTK